MAATRLRRFKSFWLYPILSAVLLVGVARFSVSPPSWPWYAWLVPTGYLLWTLIEYALHRFVFHPTGSHLGLGSATWRFHRDHHARPRDPDRILTRPQASLPVSLALWNLLYGVTGSLTGSIGVMIGVWSGFLHYEWVHYRIHTSASDRGLGGQRRRHFHHHFVDERTGFGVTWPWWDRVFGTAPTQV